MTLKITPQWIFDSVAHHYEANMVNPFFAMMAIRFTHQTAAGFGDIIRADDVVLDVGTGTGIVPRVIAKQAKQIVGIDFAPQMIEIARNLATQRFNLANLHFQIANVHHLPFATETFDVVVASFGLNATNPRRSLPEIWRVLKKGGGLYFQEWGGLHDYDDILDDVFAEYAVEDDDAPPEIVAMRDFMMTDSLWYKDLQTEADYRLDLTEYGFVDIEAREHKPIMIQISVEDFIRYKTAWTPRQFELNAMDEFARADCLDELKRRLEVDKKLPDALLYDPLVFSISAHKPH